jgi:hypothetical protein
MNNGPERPGMRGIGTSSACLRADPPLTIQRRVKDGPVTRYPDSRINAGGRVFPQQEIAVTEERSIY